MVSVSDEGVTAPAPTSFGDRLARAMADYGPLCVGIDPHPGLLDQWGLAPDVDGLRSFSLGVVEALGGRVAAFKPQAAFYERFGSAGVRVLEETIEACRDASSLCIVDAKRGDIGSTMAGYAEAYLGEGSPLAGDAVTLSPYLGVGSLAPALELARTNGRGVFVLCLTSNPEGVPVQHARGDGAVPVAGLVASEVGERNRECDFDHMGPFGLVVGATVGSAVDDLGLDLESVRGPLLAPGFGAQGAGSAQVEQVFHGVRDRVLASSSRGVLRAGPTPRGLREAHSRALEDLRGILTA